MDSDAINREMIERPRPTDFSCTKSSLMPPIVSQRFGRRRILTLLLLSYARKRRAADQPAAETRAEAPELGDRFDDGTPDFLRLDSEEDRRAFRKWFLFLAESQFYRPPKRVAREIDDCASLLRF